MSFPVKKSLVLSLATASSLVAVSGCQQSTDNNEEGVTTKARLQIVEDLAGVPYQQLVTFDPQEIR